MTGEILKAFILIFIAEIGIKMFASIIFMFFGIQKLLKTIPNGYLRVEYVIPVMIILLSIISIMVVKLFHQRKAGIQSAYRAKAELLHAYYEHVREDLDHMCMGTEFCQSCHGKACIIGHAKSHMNAVSIDKQVSFADEEVSSNYISKPFSRENAIDSLVDALWLIEHIQENSELQTAHMMRKKMECILFGTSIDEYLGYNKYFDEIKTMDKDIAYTTNNHFNLRKPIEQRIINVGNRINNIYLVEIKEGYILIDTGYEGYFKKFKSELDQKNIRLNDIAYIFITHAHDDHVGFLNELMNETTAKIIVNHNSVNRLAKGQNSFDGGCSSRLAWLFCQVMKFAGKGEHRFSPVIINERFITIQKHNKAEIEKHLSAKIIELPGHTKDSIGLLFDNNILFCGDASMNGLPSKNNIIIWIEDIFDYKKSWKKMMDLECSRVYPSHGKPFSKDKLISNYKKLNRIKSYRLFVDMK